MGERGSREKEYRGTKQRVEGERGQRERERDRESEGGGEGEG